MVKKGFPQVTPSAKGTTDKYDMGQRFKLWFIQMRTGIHTGVGEGLPQTVLTPLIHSNTFTPVFTSTLGTLSTSGDLQEHTPSTCKSVHPAKT